MRQSRRMTSSPSSSPEVLRCSGTADFLAALPRLVGYTATHSLFIVLFDENRARHAVRVDLPQNDSPSASLPLLDFICQTVHDFDESLGVNSPPAVVISSAQSFEECRGIPWLRLARRLERRLRRERIELREFCCLATDGWASFLITNDRQHSLDEIRISPVASDQPPELEHLAGFPTADRDRLAGVAAWLERIGSYDLPGADPPTPAISAPGNPRWLEETAQVAHSLRNAGAALSPRMTAQLIRTAQHPTRWFVLALCIMARPEFVQSMVQQLGDERFKRLTPSAQGVGPATETVEWPMIRLLQNICPDFTDRELARSVRVRVHLALSETPEDLRPGLLAFSAWLWWLGGNQSVAQKQARDACTLSPANEISRMVQSLVLEPVCDRPFARPSCISASESQSGGC